MWRGISEGEKKKQTHTQSEWSVYWEDGNLWHNELCIITEGPGVDLHSAT